MARQFRLLAALALAHSASSTLLEPFVDVVVRVDVQVPADIFAGVLNAAGRSDDGYDACVAADSLLGDCVDAGAFATTAQIADANRCACCVGTTAISAVYSMCASYIANEEPEASSAFSSMQSWTRSSPFGSDTMQPFLNSTAFAVPSVLALQVAGQ